MGLSESKITAEGRGGKEEEEEEENEEEEEVICGAHRVLPPGMVHFRASGMVREFQFTQRNVKTGLEFVRRYCVYSMPSHIRGVADREDHEKSPLLCLFHGSHQTMTNSAFFQETIDGHKRVWHTLAEQTGAIVLFLEASNTCLNEQHPSFQSWMVDGCWRPGANDRRYVDSVLDHVLSRFHVDTRRIYGFGHSNGGMFLGDLAPATRRFAALVNHMGGLERQPTPEEQAQLLELALGETRRLDAIPARLHCRVPTLVITSCGEDNFRPCLVAHRDYLAAHWPIVLCRFEEKGFSRVSHGFYHQSLFWAWRFFQIASRFAHSPSQFIQSLPVSSSSSASSSTSTSSSSSDSASFDLIPTIESTSSSSSSSSSASDSTPSPSSDPTPAPAESPDVAVELTTAYAAEDSLGFSPEGVRLFLGLPWDLLLDTSQPLAILQ